MPESTQACPKHPLCSYSQRASIHLLTDCTPACIQAKELAPQDCPTITLSGLHCSPTYDNAHLPDLKTSDPLTQISHHHLFTICGNYPQLRQLRARILIRVASNSCLLYTLDIPIHFKTPGTCLSLICTSHWPSYLNNHNNTD